jgi:hypothetical protein
MGESPATDPHVSARHQRAETRVKLPRGEEAGSEKNPAASLDVSPGQMYVTAAQLAHRYGVSLRWVNRYKQDLGATPISNAVNSKLRYHLGTADAYMEARKLQPLVKKPRSRRSAAKQPSHTKGLVRFV